MSDFTRRDFIKLSGIAGAALISGNVFGSYFNALEKDQLSISGFIPEDQEILNSLLKIFFKKTGSKRLLDEIKNEKIFSSDFDYNFTDSFLLRENNFSLNVTRIEKTNFGDVIISDSKNLIHSPENNFSAELKTIRNIIKTKPAHIFFSFSSNKKNVITNLFSEKRFAIIENQTGIIEKINLNKNYSDIPLKGNYGKLKLTCNNGYVRISSAECKNKLCMCHGIKKMGETIACVPNKIIIKIENA